MSTDRQRLIAAIQRIARQDPDLSALIGTSKNKGGQASSSGIGTSDAERDNLCCDGTEGGGANAGSDSRDPSDGGVDGLDSADPANIDGMGQGSLTDITDCATGQPICFDGSDWLPPDGWDDPQSPGIEEFAFFEDGSYWNAGGHESLSAKEACDLENDNDQDEFLGCEQINEDRVECRYEGITGTIDVVTANRRDCDEDPSDVCDDDPPLDDAWPEDGCTNLAIQSGKLVGSKFDPENDGSYSAPRDELEVCDADGDRILLRGSPTGGWKSIKSLSGDIDPDTGNGYLYRPNGQRVRQISPSEFRDDTV